MLCNFSLHLIAQCRAHAGMSTAGRVLGAGSQGGEYRFKKFHPKVRNHREGRVLNVKAVVAAFNQEKALVGAFSVITNLRM